MMDGKTFTDAPTALATVDTTHPAYPAVVYLASLAPGGRGGVVGVLRRVAALYGRPLDGVRWADLRYPDVLDVRRRLVESGAAPATANLTLAALRGVAREGWRAGLLDRKEYDRIRDVPRVRGGRLPAGRAATGGELAALVAAPARDPAVAGRRDAALVAVLYAAGLRRTELVSLALDDWDAPERSLTVRGKGNKERRVFLAAGAAAALDDWLLARGDWPGAIFCPVRKNGAVQPRPMTAQATYNAVRKRTSEAAVESLSPHDLRRTMVGDLLDAGADLPTVQRIAGHASPDTTSRYDRRGDRTARAAADLLHVPYVRRRT